MAMLNSASVFTMTKTPAPRSRQMTPEQYVSTSVRYAQLGRMQDVLYFLGVLASGDILFSCDDHRLRVNLQQPHIACDCAWYQHELPCGHVGAVILRLRYMARTAGRDRSSWQYQSAS